MLFDFSDSDWHFGLAGAVKMANAYPTTPLLLHHWGSVAAPDFPPFNRDPEVLYGLVINPERIRILAPGELYVAGEEHGARAVAVFLRLSWRTVSGIVTRVVAELTGKTDQFDGLRRDRDRQDRLP